MERTKKRAAAQEAAEARERAANRGWVGWLTGAGSGGGKSKDKAAGEGHEEGEDADMRGELNDEEREALQGLAAEQEDALKIGAGRLVTWFVLPQIARLKHLRCHSRALVCCCMIRCWLPGLLVVSLLHTITVCVVFEVGLYT